jgi:hypothetical protein
VNKAPDWLTAIIYLQKRKVNMSVCHIPITKMGLSRCYLFLILIIYIPFVYTAGVSCKDYRCISSFGKDEPQDDIAVPLLPYEPKEILFFDPVPRFFSYNVYKEKAIGGTQGATIMLAEHLKKYFPHINIMSTSKGRAK